MAKRYTDTEIWKTQRWFRLLSVEYKLAFFYIKDRCNHAGIYKIDCIELMEDTNLTSFNIYDFVEKVNSDLNKLTGQAEKKDRIVIVKKEFLWITSFIQFQQQGKSQTVNPTVPAAKSALQILTGFGLLKEAIDKGYITLNKGFSNPVLRDIDIDIDINSKEIKREYEGEKEKPEKYKPENIPQAILDKMPFSKNFIQHWVRWRKFKLEQFKFKYKSFDSEKSAIEKLKKISKNEEEAVLVISQAIENGYMGLYALKKDFKDKNRGGYTFSPD